MPLKQMKLGKGVLGENSIFKGEFDWTSVI
jgi:hypothetical protein